jgi:quercetin dioxygenase-like cupin family protein
MPPNDRPSDPQGIDQSRQCGWLLATTRVVETESRKWLASVLEDAHERSAGKVRRGMLLGSEGESNTVERRTQQQRNVIRYQRSDYGQWPTTATRPHDAVACATRRYSMNIQRAGSQPSSKGPDDWFTGTVRIDPLFQASPPARAAGASVTFEPGARTAWHTHPLGQTLIVTAGVGRVQRWGGPVEEIRPGDVVSFPAGEKHWHGASPTTAMTHIAIQEQLDGKMVDWMEKVSDEQYESRSNAS